VIFDGEVGLAILNACSPSFANGPLYIPMTIFKRPHRTVPPSDAHGAEDRANGSRNEILKRIYWIPTLNRATFNHRTVGLG
jgi:hypothetical protein